MQIAAKVTNLIGGGQGLESKFSGARSSFFCLCHNGPHMKELSTWSICDPSVTETFVSDVSLLGTALRELDAHSENPGLQWLKQQRQQMQKYSTKDDWLCKTCRLCEESWDPFWGPQWSSNMRLKPKLQLTVWICPPTHPYLHCYHSPTDIKGTELGVSVTLMRPKVDSHLRLNTASERYNVSVAPGCLPPCTVTRNLGMGWTCRLPS